MGKSQIQSTSDVSNTWPSQSCRRFFSIVYLLTSLMVESSWNVMAHGDTREGKWRGNWRMEWVASTLHTTSELCVSSITTADAHTSVASSRLNWLPCRFKWTHPFRWKTKSGFCACAITFQTQSTPHFKASKFIGLHESFLTEYLSTPHGAPWDCWSMKRPTDMEKIHKYVYIKHAVMESHQGWFGYLGLVGGGGWGLKSRHLKRKSRYVMSH